MRLHDTLSGELTELVPRDGDRVTMYTCGLTVRAAPHFGHALAALVPDVLRRHLLWSGYGVLHVRNITDVDDKIIDRAAAEGRSSYAVADEYARVYENEMARLRILAPQIEPRATGHILEMIGLIERLVAAGSAYEVDGDVYFAVRTYDRYGALSNRDVDALRAGARVEADERKRDPVDFALWKAAKAGEPSWPSPWGPGRPGWHIECSAMAVKHLGTGFDIHTGGVDLVFPHHENEIAQAEAAGDAFARIWMHNGHLTMDGEKMSQSIGNIVTLTDALDRWGPDALRFFFLSSHYRSPVSFSPDRLEDAEAALDRLRGFVRAAGLRAHVPDGLPTAAASAAIAPRGTAWRRHFDVDGEPAGAAEADALGERFAATLDEDLATPRAHAVLFDLIAAGNAHLAAGRQEEARALAAQLRDLGARS
jgi:cysteinyl-tRNA synthetase